MGRPGEPNNNLVGSNNRMILSGGLIDCDHLRIGQQGSGPLVGLEQIAPHYQRRAEHRPEAYHGPLLVMTEPAVAGFTPPRGGTQAPNWQHVRIRPMTG